MPSSTNKTCLEAHDMDFLAGTGSLFKKISQSRSHSKEEEAKTHKSSLMRLISCSEITRESSSEDIKIFPYVSNQSMSMEQRCDSTWVNVGVEGEVEGSPPARTDLFTCFEWVISKSGDTQNCMGSKKLLPDGTFGPIEFETREHFLHKSLRLAEGFRQKINSLTPANHFEDMEYRNCPDESLKTIRCLGMAMLNCPEFAYMEMVSQLLGIVLVPIYGTLGAEAMSVIIEDTKLSTMVVDPQSLGKMLSAWNSSHCQLPNIIMTVSPSDSIVWEYYKCEEMKKQVEALGAKVMYLNELEDQQMMMRENRHQWKPDEIWTLSYTSGTTGRPKGAMLTMRGYMTVTHDIMYTFITDRGIGDIRSPFTPTYFSYLPLAHILERTCLSSVICLGQRIGFFSGSVPHLFDEIKEAGTTLLMCVPRVLERLHMKVMDSIAAKGYVVNYMFKKAMEGKLHNQQQNNSLNHSFWDMAIMSKIKAQIVGPQFKVIVCGGAPLSTRIREEVQAMLTAKVVVGYGLTESCGAVFVQHTADVENTIGWVMKSAEAKLIDVPELEYYSKDGQGELLIRGLGLFSGYFRQPELTAAAFTEDGWFRTGDVCHIDIAAGGCAVIDRAKNCFKLVQGEYIAPEKIENVLKVAPSIDQVVVCGNTTESCCVALVSISEGFLVAHAGKTSVDLIKDSTIQSKLVAELTKVAKEGKLFGFEIPKYFIFIGRPIMPDDGFHTPTLKLKRPLFHKKFRPCINHIYEKKVDIAIDLDMFLRSNEDFTKSLL